MARVLWARVLWARGLTAACIDGRPTASADTRASKRCDQSASVAHGRRAHGHGHTAPAHRSVGPPAPGGLEIGPELAQADDEPLAYRSVLDADGADPVVADDHLHVAPDLDGA